MWTTKVKAPLLAALLMVGLFGGGLAWQKGGSAWAQTPVDPVRPAGAPDTTPAPRFEPRAKAPSLDEQEREIKRLEAQLQEKKARLAQLRSRSALDEIEAGLKKLREAAAASPRERAAVVEFEQAFARLKAHFGGVAKERPAPRKDSVVWRLETDFVVPGPIQDGVVLQVDHEAKTVLLSVGSKDGVKKGNVYRVYQGGKAMPNQTGWVRVTDVSAKWSTAEIQQDYAPRAPLQARDIIQLDRVDKKPRPGTPDVPGDPKSSGPGEGGDRPRPPEGAPKPKS